MIGRRDHLHDHPDYHHSFNCRLSRLNRISWPTASITNLAGLVPSHSRSSFSLQFRRSRSSHIKSRHRRTLPHLSALCHVSITPLFTRFRAPKRPNKILPHSHAYFVPTATNKDPPCTPLGQYRIKFYPIPTPESFVKNGIAPPKWPGRKFFPTSTPVYPLIRI